MAYNITKTDGTPIAIEDNVATDFGGIKLLGQNFVGYSDEIATNFARMLENFSHNTFTSTPVEGQLWYHNTEGVLKVYNGTTFVDVGSSKVVTDSIAPTSPVEGLLWYDSSTDQLMAYDGADWNPVSGVKISGEGIVGHTPSDSGDVDGTNITIGTGASPSGIQADTWRTTAIGYQALAANVSNDNTTAIGYRAGANATGELAIWDTTGFTYHRGKNTFIGSHAGEGVTDSYQNVAIGYKSMENANPQASGHDGSVGVGIFTLQNSLGRDNTAIGSYSFENLVNGHLNTGLGFRSGFNLSASDGVIAIGHLAAQSNALNDCIVIGNSSDTSALGEDQIIIGHGISGTVNNRVYIGNGSGHIHADFLSSGAWTSTSDARLKTNIKEDTLGLEFITKLEPKTYTWKEQDGKNVDTETVMHGLLAQDVEEALKEVGCETFNGHTVNEDGTQGISREMFVMPLITAIKELAEQNKELLARIEQLENKK